MFVFQSEAMKTVPKKTNMPTKENYGQRQKAAEIKTMDVVVRNKIAKDGINYYDLHEIGGMSGELHYKELEKIAGKIDTTNMLLKKLVDLQQKTLDETRKK